VASYSQPGQTRMRLSWRAVRAWIFHNQNAFPQELGCLLAEGLAQFVLCLFQTPAVGLRQVLSGAVDVENEHRHRRAIGIRFSTRAMLGRTLERERDLLWILEREHTLLQVEGIRVFRHGS